MVVVLKAFRLWIAQPRQSPGRRKALLVNPEVAPSAVALRQESNQRASDKFGRLHRECVQAARRDRQLPGGSSSRYRLVEPWPGASPPGAEERLRVAAYTLPASPTLEGAAAGSNRR